MTSIHKARTGSVLALTLALAGLTACGHNTAPPIGAASPRPPVTQPATTAPAEQPSTTPTTPQPPATTAPAGTVLSSRVSYPWHWPNDVNLPGEIGHTHHVPPVPELIAISAGEHPSDPGEQSYNRLSFTFTAAFPSYQFRFVNALVTDPGGRTVRLAGHGVLRVTFRQAQAHRSDGTSSVISQPPRHLGYTRMVSWAPAGDFEGVLTYGIGIASSASDSNPQFTVRAIEVEKVNAQGQHLYVVAIDIGASAR